MQIAANTMDPCWSLARRILVGFSLFFLTWLVGEKLGCELLRIKATRPHERPSAQLSSIWLVLHNHVIYELSLAR
jgi:hypothetical protein